MLVKPGQERRAWAQGTSPSPGGADARLNGVAAFGTSAAWAVGSYSALRSGRLIKRWNGRAWTQAANPTPAGSRGSNLTAIAARYYYADAKPGAPTCRRAARMKAVLHAHPASARAPIMTWSARIRQAPTQPRTTQITVGIRAGAEG